MNTSPRADRPARDHLAVALDYPSIDAARPVIASLAPHVGWFKVGLQLFAASGPAALAAVVASGAKAFVDLKLHDIPNTVKGAVGSLCRSGASLCTIHASGGRAMIAAAAEAARASGSDLRIVAVTALTSLDDAAVGEIGWSGGAGGTVERLLKLAVDAGAHGCVMSPVELPMARAIAPRGFFIVTPGIRAPGDAAGDQARTASPADAIAAGSDLLVVGRPITNAKDPAARAQEFVRAIEEGLARRK